jgi:hypothetical protein
MASRPLPLPSPDGSRAVLIGVHRYSELDDLPAVERNVRRLRELFTDPDLWGLPDDHCVTVLDDDDPRTIPGTIREAARAASDLLVVYYAGHGLLPYDTDRFCLALPSSTKDDTYRAVRYEAVRLAIASAGPDVAKLVILDCCFAARALDAAMGGTTQSLEELSRIEGACTLTASDETSIALAPPGETYTAFTGELISAIENGVPGAPECLDVATLYRHLTSTLESKGLPLPQLFSRGGGGNLRLVRNRAAASQHAVDLPDGLRSLVEAQLRAADDFPYRLVGARRSSLSAVYVRQQMTESRPDREMEGPDTVPGSAPERSAQASASVRTLEDALRLHPHLVITGGPGLGKSTTTLQLAGQLAQALIDPSTPPPPGEDRLIPLRVTATALAEGHAPLFRRLRDAAAAELGLHLDAPLPGDLLEHPPQGCTWLLIVDGVDEITDPVRKDALIRQLAARTADGSGLRLLITTRPLPGTELETLRRSTVGHYQLERFTPERLREFAERWFGTGRPGGRTAEEFLNAARRAGPSELVRVPLLATITAIVYEQSPSAALPGNRYVLYQHYLSYLRTARAEATSEQWRRIRNRIGDVPGADPGPLDYLPELLEHLAEKAVGGTSDVKPHAIEWMERHGGGPLWVPEWPDLVAGFLDSTGLFVHTPARQRFIHHSFAEHLAGQAAARRLAQEFDPESPAWTGLVHRAKKDDQVAITALVAHSQDNPSGAPLLRWLEEGPGTHRTLAGELLAEGIRATERDEHVRRLLKYCDRILWGLGQGALESLRKRLWQVLGKLGDETVQHFLRASAVDPRRLGHDRLQAIQALPPGTNDDRHVWLRAIGLDPAALPGDRISALRDLARLDPQTREEAVKAMRAIVNAADAAPLLRSVAAEELAEAEPGHTDEAITALRQIMADDAVQPTTRSFAARSFATIAPSQTEEAVTVLHEIINSSSNPWERAYAADDLGAIEPRHAAEATTVMRECLNHPSTTAGQRTSIARWFADLGPDHTDEAVERLHEIIRSPACSPSVRQHAAEALSEIAPDRAAETTGSLMELISAPGVPADERVTLAETLTAIAPDRSGEIDVPLRRIIEGPDTTTNTRVHAAGVLATRVAEISAQGTRVLDEILTDATLKPTSRLRTVRWLRETGQWDIGRTARAVHEIMDLPGTPFTSRNRAAKWLTEFGPPYRDLGVRALEEVIAGPGPLDDRIHAALTLEELGDEQRVNAVTAVRRLMKLPPTVRTHSKHSIPWTRVPAVRSSMPYGKSCPVRPSRQSAATPRSSLAIWHSATPRRLRRHCARRSTATTAATSVCGPRRTLVNFPRPTVARRSIS